VTIEIVVRIPYHVVRDLVERIEDLAEPGVDGTMSGNLDAPRGDVLKAIDPTAPDSHILRRMVEQADSFQSLGDALDESNRLTVRDTGEGMSLKTLNDVFLMIGTRSRLAARSEHPGNGSSTTRPVLGEKGLGRLSAMRLGTRLRVQSSTAGEPAWNLLDIDWSAFSHESDALLESVQIEAKRGTRKENPSESGTQIIVTGLTSEWTKERLDELVKSEFSKLTDPFTSRTIFPVQFLYNTEPVSIPRFNKLLLENAHATVHARFESLSGLGMRLAGSAHYKDREIAFAIEGPHLVSTADTTVRVLESLGPFELEVYWYNRRILTALEGIGDRSAVLRLVREWGGGIMVFRDGFRVLPYGGPDDDWLELDRKALASGGYKVNRTQIIGRLRISSATNPALIDQTNREGLRDCEEERALVLLLKHILQSELRPFLNATDRELKAREPIYIEEMEERVEEEEQTIRNNLSELIRRVPEVGREQPLVDGIRDAVERLRVLMTDVRELASSFEAGRGQLLNLAGIGLTVEVLAHELNRATEYVLLTLANASDAGLASPVDALVRTLETQLRTLQKRLRILDPLSTAARQRKETFDLVEVVRDTLDAHRDQFARERIDCVLTIEPAGISRLRIKAVRGMVVQVLENLIANSVYWLRQQRIADPTHECRIVVTIDADEQELSVTDNGPGITQGLEERVFEAFFTTKPAGQGKGLGLFIAREIARYHGADLSLAKSPEGGQNTCRTFVLSLVGMSL
jgi:signal transduction histidine kinase